MDMPHILGNNLDIGVPIRYRFVTGKAKMCSDGAERASVGVVSNTLRGNSPTSFFTDHYELTMVDAARKAGTANRRSVFELFSRRLPTGRRYGVSAGQGRFLEGLANFRFDDEHLGFLSDHHVVSEDTLNWLAEYRFTGNIYAYAEGEPYFPHSPIMQVEATFQEAVILETYLLSVHNYDTAVASAASRMTMAAGGRPCIEMGSRRAHEEAAAAAARAAAIAGFASTSNLTAGLRYGIPTAGTAAHSFTLLHDDEKAAFQAQVAVMGNQTTLLVDTYNIERGIRNAVDVAGPELAYVRIDSGDLLEEAHHARRLLDELGNTNTGIVVTSDLDEYAIAGLRSAPVDSYGVGTQLVTGSGAPTASLVYKLTTREDQHGNWVDVQKQAEGKSSRGGRKYAARRMDQGVATAEVVIAGQEPDWDANHRPLLVQMVNNGDIDTKYTGASAVELAAAQHQEALTALPRDARRLQDGEPAIPTVYALH